MLQCFLKGFQIRMKKSQMWGKVSTRWSPWGQPGSAFGRVPMLSLTQILRGIHLAEFCLQSKFLFGLPKLVSQVLAWWHAMKPARKICGRSVVAGISDPIGLYLKRKEEERRKKNWHVHFDRLRQVLKAGLRPGQKLESLSLAHVSFWLDGLEWVFA